ncbi:hypothetical protein [Blastopirellula marina]|uniref:Glycoside hydrolase family 65 C-terminal domain-containing protein n=1 Tax=Blastopirellula marina TaxID=124 RepID=A0A2S8F4W3_9BACT|nr:hypothetical protein [Blastopirellula marina]PQO27196.1 hypothetical protein C5Y98_28540 [Blastopirellula marina]PTL41343.1 hypothetical protein C5Y97_28555 [Blastopirellula marina]
MFTRLMLAPLASLLCCQLVVAQERLPEFRVPGKETLTQPLEGMFQRHHSAKTNCSLWDAWLPMSTLWPAIGNDPSASECRDFYRRVYLAREIDASGYVTMNQHRGHAHPGGWPFPLWEQAGGAGWHFTVQHDPYREMMQMRTMDAKAVEFVGAEAIEQSDRYGLQLTTTGETTSLTLPVRPFDSFVAPFVVIEWSSDKLPADAAVQLQWRHQEDKQFSAAQSIDVVKDSGVGGQYGAGLKLSVVPMFTHEKWNGRIEQLRLTWTNQQPQRMTIRNIHTATDTRHPITNALYVRGCCEYFGWTRDVNFLRKNIERMRTAVAYSLREFRVREEGAMLVTWPGHDGRAGFTRDANGHKQTRHGRGVGNNYWDLLPFGHYDCYASIIEFDMLRAMAKLEQAIATHPAWEVGAPKLTSEELNQIAADLKANAGQRFWDAEKGRFVACIDADGVAHDFGFTFLNLEAIYYDFATPEQAKQILSWVEGARVVEGDTSTGADIYHWRFAPRATTKRNIDWYCWVWNNPESIAWGGQVQDGGAVLGFSYHDLMARLKVLGPDNAAARLSEITRWYAEVEAEGGYRAYYAKPGRGSLQGGGTPGGLGLDHEFFESVLVPQVMLYGFLGFQPTSEGYAIDPQLPADWPSLEVTRIAAADHVIDVKASRETLEIGFQKVGTQPLKLQLPPGPWKLTGGEATLEGQTLSIDPERSPRQIRVERE